MCGCGGAGRPAQAAEGLIRLVDPASSRRRRFLRTDHDRSRKFFDIGIFQDELVADGLIERDHAGGPGGPGHAVPASETGRQCSLKAGLMAEMDQSGTDLKNILFHRGTSPSAFNRSTQAGCQSAMARRQSIGRPSA